MANGEALQQVCIDVATIESAARCATHDTVLSACVVFLCHHIDQLQRKIGRLESRTLNLAEKVEMAVGISGTLVDCVAESKGVHHVNRQ